MMTFIVTIIGSDASTVSSDNSGKELSSRESIGEENQDEPSIWDSPPVEQYEANIQILDKISGKVFRKRIKVGNLVIFGTIGIRLKRCFRNSPEEKKEVYAFLEVEENKRKIFSDWLFASSLSTNLFSHQVYDIRVEFDEIGAK
jgi:hypothetical protein